MRHTTDNLPIPEQAHFCRWTTDWLAFRYNPIAGCHSFCK